MQAGNVLGGVTMDHTVVSQQQQLHSAGVMTQAVLDQLQQQQQQVHHQQQQEIMLAPAQIPPNQTIVTIQEAERGIEMLEFFRKQREREKFCDLVLHVHGKKFYAHRMVLAAGSAYFDSIFKAKTTIREHLAVSCQDPETFQTFLNYFYTGSVTLDKDNVGELIRLSNHFLVTKLKVYCANFLERLIDAENCHHVKHIAEKYQLHDLLKTVTEFIQNNLGEVINHEIMMELPPKQIEDFIKEKVYGLPQEAAVKFMSRWVFHDLANRERDFKQLLTNVRWHDMDSNVIVDYIDQEPLYGSSERCFYYVLRSLADKGIQVQKYDPMYQALQERFAQEADPGGVAYGDNLLQMAFNSAMEGLTDSTTLLMGDSRETNKWNDNDPASKTKQRLPKSLTLEQRRVKILAKIHRDRSTQRWVRLRSIRPRKRRLAFNEELEESSGDEECDPVQTEQGYRCHLCPFATKKVSRLERHISTIHAHDVTYRCSECGFTCKWNREYFIHMKSHYVGPPYRCQSCDYECDKIGSLIAHKVSHTEMKAYQCCDCDFKCRIKANLAAHMKMHNNEKPYRCNICGRTFSSKNSLDQHAVGHNSEKTYNCSSCPFSTRYFNHFANHKKSHQATGTTKKKESYRCPDGDCKYTTNKKSQLESHLRSHAGVRPHVCSICGRRFLEKSHLVRHERIHYNERPFKCEECDYASTRRDKLKEHKSRHHGASASAKSPYKPRPHKGSGKGSTVYGKKSSAKKAQSQSASQVSQGIQQPQQRTATVTTAAGDLQFIIPHGQLGSSDSAAAAFSQIVGAQGGSIDLQQMANAGLVQVRSYPGGHGLTSIPTSMSSAELQRTLGIKLEDLQSQGLIGSRGIKLEDLGVNVQTNQGGGGTSTGNQQQATTDSYFVNM